MNRREKNDLPGSVKCALARENDVPMELELAASFAVGSVVAAAGAGAAAVVVDVVTSETGVVLVVGSVVAAGLTTSSVGVVLTSMGRTNASWTVRVVVT